MADIACVGVCVCVCVFASIKREKEGEGLERMRGLEGKGEGRGSGRKRRDSRDFKVKFKMYTERVSFCRLQLLRQQLQRGIARLAIGLEVDLSLVCTRRVLNTTPRLRTGSTFALKRAII